MGEGIGEQVQVQHVTLYPDIGDVGCPDIVHVPHLQPFHQVGVFAVDMVGVCHVYRFDARQLVAFGGIELQEGVAVSRYLFPQVIGNLQVELRTAYPSVQPSIVVH